VLPRHLQRAVANRSETRDAVVIEREGTRRLVDARMELGDECDIAALITDLSDATEDQRFDVARRATARLQRSDERAHEFIRLLTR